MLAFRMALRSISSNKLRALLTMLGIIIGVTALVVLVSLVNGATSSVTNAVSSLGSDTITVSVSDDKGKPLSLADLDAWAAENEEAGCIAPNASQSVTGKYGSDSITMTVMGTTPSYYHLQSLQLAYGRFLNSADMDNNTSVCVLNYAAAEDLIGYADCVGKVISLDGSKYTIVGVLGDDETLTNSMTSGTKTAYVPYTTLIRQSTSLSLDISSFVASSSESSSMEALEEKLTALLNERFDEDEDAYTVSSMNVMENAMSSITSVLSLLLGGIAAISLIVGGIGIMNIMLVTVTERTREIGIRKAVGATRGTILRQFLMEAVVLCMLGCVIGIFLSWTLLRIVGTVVSSLSLTFKLNGAVVLIAVLFCFAIGIIFGLYPANKAAKMKPIDALHYGG